MALGFTCQARLATTSGATSYATANTYTPGANRLLIALIIVSASEQTDPPNGVTGHGVTFTQKTVQNLSTTHRLFVYVADSGASPTSAAVTIGTWASNRTGCIIFEYEVTGADLSGGAAAAIVQVPTNNGTATSGTVTLSAAGAAGNRPMSFWCHLANEATTPRTNWTEDATPQASDGNYNTPATGGEAQHRDDAFETTGSASWTGNVAWRGIGLEVKASTGQTVTVNQATETDAAQASTSAKLRAVGQAAETLLAQVVTGLKTRAIGQAAETSLAQAIGVRKIVAVLQAIETDLAQAIARLKSRLLGQAGEADTAQSVVRNPVARLLLQVAESDLAMAVTKAGGGAGRWLRRLGIRIGLS